VAVRNSCSEWWGSFCPSGCCALGAEEVAAGLQKQAWHCAGGKGAQLATRAAVPLLLRGRHLTAGAALRFCCRLDNLWSRTGDDEKDTLLGAPLQFVG
jgi:hypothetical protein